MKPIQSLKVSISGVRGVIGDSLKPLLLCRFARAFATYLGRGTIVVGRDTRTSGEMVEHAVVAGLLSSGMQVIDIGICPVPTVQFAVRRLKTRGGIAITASHNPAQWNALKFVKQTGCFLNGEEAEELLNLYHQDEFFDASVPELRPLETYSRAGADHLDHILDSLSPPLSPRLRVAVDCCNGAGSIVTPQLLRRLGCEVIEMNTRPDGRFPRPPEPIPAHLEALCQLVKKSGADVGFAQDADADRLSIVSERGLAIGEEYTLALCAFYVLEREKGNVVVNLSTSRMIDDIAHLHRCHVFRTRIGEVHVTETMEQEEAVFGGEGNGGVIYPKVNLARDSLTALTLILSLMRSTGRTISELIQLFPTYHQHKETFEIHPHRMHLLIDRLAEEYAEENVNRLDGLKINRPGGWIHLRPSNTEPILRLVIEAGDEATLSAYRRELREKIEQTAQADSTTKSTKITEVF